MQKKLIVLAIASALTVPAMAQAEVTVYGQANMSYDRVNTGAKTNAATQNQLVSNNSRVGLKGSEDLGGGLTALWQMEAGVSQDTGNVGAATSKSKFTYPPVTGTGTGPATPTGVDTTTTSQFFNRNTFLGVKSAEMGTVLFGNYDTPYKSSVRRLDVFADSAVADNRTYIFALDARRKNSINYISPSFSGLTVAFSSVFGAESTSSSADAKGSANSLSVAYEQGPIYAALATDSAKAGDAGTGDFGAGYAPIAIDPTAQLASGDKLSGTKLGAGYTTTQFAAGLIIEKVKYTGATGGEDKSTNLYLGGKFNISATDAVKLAYGKRGATTSGDIKRKDEAKQITVGYDHGMSKATSVYALYTKVTADVDAIPNANDPSVLSFGMKHAF